VENPQNIRFQKCSCKELEPHGYFYRGEGETENILEVSIFSVAAARHLFEVTNERTTTKDFAGLEDELAGQVLAAGLPEKTEDGIDIEIIDDALMAMSNPIAALLAGMADDGMITMEYDGDDFDEGGDSFGFEDDFDEGPDDDDLFDERFDDDTGLKGGNHF